MTLPPTEDTQESKVLFINGQGPRSIRGVISSEDDDFIELSRRDGSIRINKKAIIKIETRK